MKLIVSMLQIKCESFCTFKAEKMLYIQNIYGLTGKDKSASFSGSLNMVSKTDPKQIVLLNYQKNPLVTNEDLILINYRLIMPLS